MKWSRGGGTLYNIMEMRKMKRRIPSYLSQDAALKECVDLKLHVTQGIRTQSFVAVRNTKLRAELWQDCEKKIFIRRQLKNGQQESYHGRRE